MKIIKFIKKAALLFCIVSLFVQPVFGHNIKDSIAKMKHRVSSNLGEEISDAMIYELLYTCALDSNNQLEIILKEYPPTKDNIIIDIGSGTGACSRLLALIGYTVYSIDSTLGMVSLQKNNFCDFPVKSILEKLDVQKFDRSIHNEDTYTDYCKETLKNRVHFIEGDFSDENVISSITRNHPKWNVVIALDSLQFFNNFQREEALKSINKNLVSGGILIVSTLPKKYYGNDMIFGGIHDFSIEHKLLRYNILSKYTIYDGIYNKQYNTNYPREKWYPKFLRLVTLIRNKP